jgi:hypothetical protein
MVLVEEVAADAPRFCEIRCFCRCYQRVPAAWMSPTGLPHRPLAVVSQTAS